MAEWYVNKILWSKIAIPKNKNEVCNKFNEYEKFRAMYSLTKKQQHKIMIWQNRAEQDLTVIDITLWTTVRCL
jgi:hypothetical protein